MGMFSRAPRSVGPPLCTATPDDLRRIGEAAFGGEGIYPPGIGGVPAGELDGYAVAYLTAAGYPAAGSTEAAVADTRFLVELIEAAGPAGDWGYVGAACVAWNSVHAESHSTTAYLGILNRALEVLRTDGVSYTAVPPFLIDRWTSVHGYGETGPMGWPSALEDLPVPSADDAPQVEELVEGELRRLARSPSSPENLICAERRTDGSIQAVMEGVDETGELRRWDWYGVEAPDYRSFLRELGERLVTHTHWAHDDLIPYFPCRTLSRSRMRSAARESFRST